MKAGVCCKDENQAVIQAVGHSFPCYAGCCSSADGLVSLRVFPTRLGWNRKSGLAHHDHLDDLDSHSKQGQSSRESVKIETTKYFPLLR